MSNGRYPSPLEASCSNYPVAESSGAAPSEQATSVINHSLGTTSPLKATTGTSPPMAAPTSRPGLRKQSSPFVRSNRLGNKRPEDDIAKCSIEELEHRLARNTRLLENPDVAEKLHDGGSKLHAHHDLLKGRIDELKGLRDIRHGIHNTHIAGNQSSSFGQRMDLPRSEHHYLDNNDFDDGRAQVKKEDDEDIDNIKMDWEDSFDEVKKEPVKEEEEVEEEAAVDEERFQQDETSRPSVSPSNAFGIPITSRSMPSSSDRARYLDMRYQMYMKENATSPNSRMLSMNMEDSLRLQEIEAHREREMRERAARRQERLVQQGLSRARDSAIAEYLTKDYSDEEEMGSDEDEFYEQDREVAELTGEEQAETELVEAEENERETEFGQFGKAYVEGYNRDPNLALQSDEQEQEHS